MGLRGKGTTSWIGLAWVGTRLILNELKGRDVKLGLTGVGGGVEL